MLNFLFCFIKKSNFYATKLWSRVVEFTAGNDL